jgi:UDP-2,3-diacylglucosamine pyrophosphatase LpxH
MRERVYVVSDLHLGGRAGSGDQVGFQMCSRLSQARLVEFLRFVCEDAAATELVVLGDIVDFLAEEPFSAFTEDPELAERKLDRAVKETAAVWQGLRECLRRDLKVTLLLGNHDIELALPGPRRALIRHLGPGPLELITDNEAYVIGGAVLLEHGNRYDGWNSVPHDLLRQRCSALSRRETSAPFPPLPGSLLVERVMNPLKQRYAFIDLLKPETSGALPLLAVLDPSVVGELSKVFELYRQQRRVRLDAASIPIDPRHIGVIEDEALLSKAQQFGGPGRDIGLFQSAGLLIDTWRAARTIDDRRRQIDRLSTALRLRAESHTRSFDIGTEDERYLRPARQAAKRGFRYVIYGHTHLAKRVAQHGDLGGSDAPAARRP